MKVLPQSPTGEVRAADGVGCAQPFLGVSSLNFAGAAAAAGRPLFLGMSQREKYLAFRADYESGMPVAAIAAKYGYTGTAPIYRHVVPNRRRVLIDEAMACALSAEGMPYRRIGELYGVSAVAIHKAIKRHRGLV